MSTIRTECPRCGQRYKLGEEFAGKEVECTDCGLKFTLPPRPVPKSAKPAAKPNADALGECPIILTTMREVGAGGAFLNVFLTLSIIAAIHLRRR